MSLAIPESTRQLTHSCKTEILDINSDKDLSRAVDLIVQGKIVIAAFNGVFGIFGKADSENVARRIIEIKDRPEDKNLVLVTPPEFLNEFVDLTSSVFERYPLEKIKRLYKEAFALGIILPAAITGVPHHLTKNGTILNIWTEYRPYEPLRKLINLLRQKKECTALAGTSANKCGRPTFTNTRDVFEEFKNDVAAVLSDSFFHLPPHRKKSTTVIDLTNGSPFLCREGNMPETEIRQYVKAVGLGDLVTGEDTIRVDGIEEC